MASRMYETFRPSAVIGFGGYPALAGSARRAQGRHPDPDPRAECGARAGQPADGEEGRRDRHRLSGRRPAEAQASGTRPIWSAIPVRDEVLALRDQPFPPLSEDGIFRVLVVGGSQGATILSDVVPGRPRHAARAFPPPAAGDSAMPARRISSEVRRKYASHGIPADLATYIADLPARLAWSHLVIARAGRLDHRRADRGRPPGDPGAAADRDRQPPGGERARNGEGGRRADDPPVEVHSGRACQADAEARARSASRSTMPPNAPRRSAARTPPATSPTWSSAPAATSGRAMPTTAEFRAPSARVLMHEGSRH